MTPADMKAQLRQAYSLLKIVWYLEDSQEDIPADEIWHWLQRNRDLGLFETVTLPEPTPEQAEYLESCISKPYDPKTMIGEAEGGT